MKAVDTPAAVESRAAHTPPRTEAREHLLIAAGLAVAAILSVVLYWRTTGIGFLLDDLLHVEYLYQAFHGAPQALLSRLVGGWSYTTDGLACYRPGTSLSLALDYLLWNANAFGWHLSNLLQLAANTILVGLIASHLCCHYGVRHRAFASAASALLFACYPLHAESASWIIGRVDLLCTMFYLASFYCFLRATNGIKHYIWTALSLAAFLASLTCKEMAVTLPVVLGLAALLLPGTGAATFKQALLRAIKVTAPYWLLLAAFAGWRTHVIGTLVGGYGATNKRAIIQGLQNFVDGATWFKVIHGVTDEYPSPPWLQLFTFFAAATASCSAALVMLRSKKFVGLYAFLAAWLFVALVPAFQILHVFPNLLGSRLFFLSSVPLCIFIAVSFAQVPTAATEESKQHRAWLVACATSVGILAVAWATLLSVNLQAWLDAGKRMAKLHNQALEILSNSAPTETILFANLPADYKGAGLIGRPEFLRVMCKPPLAPQDFSNRIMTSESILPGPHDYVAPTRLRNAIGSAGVTYVYSDVDGGFVPLQSSYGTGEWSTKKISTVQQQDVLWLSQTPLNPLQAQAIAVGFDKPADELGHVQLVWRSPSQEWWRCVADPAFAKGNHVIFIPARQRVWTYGLPIQQFGLRMTKPAQITELSACGAENFEPKLSTKRNQIFVDGSLLTGVSKIRVFVSNVEMAFPDFAITSQPDPKSVAWSTDLSGNSGVAKVPRKYIASGRQQVCALALDEHEQPVGVLSEPIALQN